MSLLPEGLITQPTGYQNTGSSLVLKPTFGTVGTCYVRFFMHREYSELDSEKSETEQYREIEMCEVQTDSKSRVAIRVKDLNPQQKIDFASIYNRFKTQRDSTDTGIVDWPAITDSEKGYLLGLGIYTVEQIAAIPQHELHRLGPGGVDLQRKAVKHITGKNASSQDLTEELQTIRQEAESARAKAKEFEAKYFEELARNEKKKKDRQNDQQVAA